MSELEPRPLFLPPRVRYAPSDGGGRAVERVQLDDGGEAQFCIVGLPFDAAIRTRPGARRGPDAFRTALARFAADPGEERWPIGSRLTDLGDIDLAGLSVNEAHERVLRAMATVLPRVDCAVAIGGDQSLTFPVVEATTRVRGGRWGLITLDAHHDVRAYGRDSISSGTSVRRCADLPSIEPASIAQIGIRSFANSADHRAWCEDRGIIVYGVETVRERGAARVARDAIERLSRDVDLLYVSIDLDVIDQAQAPGTSAAAPDGLSVQEVLETVSVLASSSRFAGGDIMELSPRWDWGGETARVAARIFLAIASARWTAYDRWVTETSVATALN